MRPKCEARGRRPKADRGVVLVLVLVVTAILNVTVLDLSENMLVVQRATHNGDRRVVAFYNARSAVNLGRLTLVLQAFVNSQMSAQKGGRGGVDIAPWSGMLLDMFASEATRSAMLEGFAGIPGDLVSGFATLDGSFAVTVVDEDGRINVNLAAQGDESQQWLDRVLSQLAAPSEYDEMFGSLGPDGQVTTREQFVAATIDWADTNEQLYVRAAASGGVEDNVYETLPDPYVRKDAPFDSIEEIRLVRGVGEDLWQTFLDPDPLDPGARTLTIWGQGKINLNAAPLRVLAAVICALAVDQRACDPRNFERVLLLAAAVKEAAGSRFGSPNQFVRMVGSGTEDAPGIAIDGSLADKWLATTGRVFSLYVVGTAPVAGKPAARAAAVRERPAEPSRREGRARREAEPQAQARAEDEADEGGTPAVAPEVVVRLHVVVDTTPPWHAQGGRILYWREL
ncbi:MAG: type II secretion system protein GspK [Myxococcota bacterium]|nr:type II secretion system protein GspK [Myxococcota bacterium]